MLKKLAAKLKDLRERLWRVIARRHKAKPGSEERERLAELKREIEREKAAIIKRMQEIRERREKPSLKNVKVTRTPGEPHWGGSGDVVAEIEAFMVERGLPLGSGKRTPAYNASIGGSATSAHLTTRTTTDARDFPTYSGLDDAAALAKWCGISGWSPNSYVTYTISADGEQFTIQILWGAGIAHGDHVHVGVTT